MDVLTLLKKDHREVIKLLDRALDCDPEDEQLHDLATEIEEALTVHATIEEKYFYPLLQKRSENVEDTVDVFEAYTEHDLLKRLIALLKSGRQPDEQFKAEVQVLCESVKHHVKEEESTIFALAKETVDSEELDELGVKMENAKQRLMVNGSGRTASSNGRTQGTARKSSGRKAAHSQKR